VRRGYLPGNPHTEENEAYAILQAVEYAKRFYPGTLIIVFSDSWAAIRNNLPDIQRARAAIKKRNQLLDIQWVPSKQNKAHRYTRAFKN